MPLIRLSSSTLQSIAYLQRYSELIKSDGSVSDETQWEIAK